MQFDQLLDQGQTQAGAVIFPAKAVIDLTEARKDCEIASKFDPAGKERMSLIAHMNTFPQWGHVTYNKVAHPVLIFFAISMCWVTLEEGPMFRADSHP